VTRYCRSRLERLALDSRSLCDPLPALYILAYSFREILRECPAARAGITRYVAFYNNRRPHQGLDGQTPDTLYFTQPPLAAAPLAEEIIEKLRRMSRPYQTEIVREGERWLVRP
jgi:hypothetical protein